MEPAKMTQGTASERGTPKRASLGHFALVALAAIVGVALLVDVLGKCSATYDEVAYLRIAARWWRTGAQEQITRMGSPLSFWKIQQAPVLWLLDRSRLAPTLDDPEPHLATLLPILRAGALWIWLVAFLITACWSRRVHGPRAMVLAAWLYTLSPNLLAHGALITMEMPLIACAAGVFALFERYLATKRRSALFASAAIAGVAFSCKFSAVLFPIILTACWLTDELTRQQSGIRSAVRVVVAGMCPFMLVMIAANLFVTGFALLPISERTGEHPAVDRVAPGPVAAVARQVVETPLPQDWVGFATQLRHQRSGGPSYLLGERRTTGWWYYYLVAIAAKVPLAVLFLVAIRNCVGPRTRADRMIVVAIALFLAIAALGSTRNYGVRYVLPLAPLVIVWLSGIAEGPKWARGLAIASVFGQGIAVASIHPHELTFFNRAAGGTAGGRRILADSNLDWGQGLKALARLQKLRPDLRDLTLYYFGDTRPEYYGVAGDCYVVDAGDTHPGLPRVLEAKTKFLAVSTSLQYGPWGTVGYFSVLDGVSPAAWTDDQTIAIYRSADVPALRFAAGRKGDAERK
jgi:hypothetical protein